MFAPRRWRTGCRGQAIRTERWNGAGYELSTPGSLDVIPLPKWKDGVQEWKREYGPLDAISLSTAAAVRRRLIRNPPHRTAGRLGGNRTPIQATSRSEAARSIGLVVRAHWRSACLFADRTERGQGIKANRSWRVVSGEASGNGLFIRALQRPSGSMAKALGTSTHHWFLVRAGGYALER